MKLSIGKCWGLLVFDLVGLAIAGYAYLLGFQIIQTLPQANAFIILMGFFVGIKIVILALYDLNRNVMLKNIPFIGGAITILGNGIIFGISLFLIPEVPYYFFIGLALVDFLFISLTHFLWWVIIGKDTTDKKTKEDKPSKSEKTKKAKKDSKSKKETKGKWLSENNEEDEYDSIFDALLEKNQHNLPPQVERDTSKPPIPPRNIFEEEKKYETGEFLKDIRKNRNQGLERPRSDQELPIKWEIEGEAFASKESAFYLNEGQSQSSDSPLKDQPLELKTDDFTLRGDTFGLKTDDLALEDDTFGLKDDVFALEDEALDLKSEAFVLQGQASAAKGDQPTSSENDSAIVDRQEDLTEAKSQRDETPHIFEIDKEFVLDQPSLDQKKTSVRERAKIEDDLDFEIKDDDDFNSIEKRLGFLFNEIENSMKETHYLQEAIAVFSEEIESYKPIKGDEKILAAGNLIREKLKAIIDKQFVVDEVLDDLIHLSKVINKRIEDLDRIEAGLNKRKASLDQKEELLVDDNKISRSQNIEILPQELVVENLDSEYIVAGEDYEIIQRYLKKMD